MTLQDHIDSLSGDLQFSLALKLTKLVLPIWEMYVDNNGATYRDTVVGLSHSVRKDLLRDTVLCVERYIEANRFLKPIIKNTELRYLENDFSDPIVALQDADWELPHEVLMAFYSINNLLDATLSKEKTMFNETTLYIVVNQAISALERSQTYTVEEIREMVYSNNGR